MSKKISGEELAAYAAQRATEAPRMPDSWADADLSWGSLWDGWTPDEAFQFGFQTAMEEIANRFAATPTEGENQ